MPQASLNTKCYYSDMFDTLLSLVMIETRHEISVPDESWNCFKPDQKIGNDLCLQRVVGALRLDFQKLSDRGQFSNFDFLVNQIETFSDIDFNGQSITAKMGQEIENYIGPMPSTGLMSSQIPLKMNGLSLEARKRYNSEGTPSDTAFPISPNEESPKPEDPS